MFQLCSVRNKDRLVHTCFCFSEAEDFQPTPAKVELKSNWDDEDVDENDIKDSWEEEDDDEPAPVYFFSSQLVA